jgi:hypothetical protein
MQAQNSAYVMLRPTTKSPVERHQYNIRDYISLVSLHKYPTRILALPSIEAGILSGIPIIGVWDIQAVF